MAKAPVEQTEVKMDDGRSVIFTGKKRLLKETIIDGDKAKVRLDFVNGETRTFTVPQASLLQFAAHGASQKLGDEISDVTDLEDAVETIDQLMQRLDKGQWLADRAVGSGMAGASLLAKALVEITGQPITVVRDYLATLDGKTKKALEVSSDVQPVFKRLQAERDAKAAASGKSKPTIDTAAVLGNLKAGIAAPGAVNPSILAEAPAAPL